MRMMLLYKVISRGGVRFLVFLSAYFIAFPKDTQEFSMGDFGAFRSEQRCKKAGSGMRQDVAKLVAECGVCQRNKHCNLSPIGLLQPMFVPQRIWEDLTMDFVDALPKSKGYSVIMVAVDLLSKSAHFAPLKHHCTITSVATVFLREIIRLHGVPKSIISDRDRVFVSHFWRELFKYPRTTLKRSTAYHP
nr:putative integrase [Tanacetum cinerariifolium]